MHFTSAITAAALVFGVAAWTPKADGTMVANNVIYTFPDGKRYHEACTYAGTQTSHGGNCAFWQDSKVILCGTCNWFSANKDFWNCNPYGDNKPC